VYLGEFDSPASSGVAYETNVPFTILYQLFAVFLRPPGSNDLELRRECMFRKLLLFVLSSVMIPSVAAAQSRSDFVVSGLRGVTGFSANPAPSRTIAMGIGV
jgi:hypothetical protein